METAVEIRRKGQQLEKQRRLLEDKIAKLREALIVETGAEVKFQLGVQIETAEGDLKKVNQEIKTLEESQLYGALTRLDYHRQVFVFRQFVAISQIAAFLIHGEPQFGQRWLLNRLAQRVPKITTGKRINIDFGRRVRGTSIAALWRELSGRVGGSSQDSPVQIAMRVRDWWKTQPVIFTFYNINQMSEDYLQTFIEGFWCPLVKDLAQSASTEFPLILFLVDESGEVNQWRIAFAEAFDKTWRPDLPIKLPAVSKFTPDILSGWIENETETLPLHMLNAPQQVVAELLAQSEDGVPELVLECICSRCDHNWYEGVDRWLSF